MKYKILTMDRKTLEKFNGKIIEILKKKRLIFVHLKNICLMFQLLKKNGY